jgi:hypothetical protein
MCKIKMQFVGRYVAKQKKMLEEVKGKMQGFEGDVHEKRKIG